MADVSRETSWVELPPEVSGEIWQKVQESSAVAALSRTMTLPGAGVQVEIITQDPEPTWVGETEEIGVSKPAAATKLMRGYKLGVIVPFSNEFRRDKAALYDAFVQRLPGRLAQKIDETIFNGTAPGSDFDVLTNATAVSLAVPDTVYENLVDLEVAIAEAGYALNGFALSARGVGLLRKVKDLNGLPLLAAMDGLDSILGYPVRRTQLVHKVVEDQPDVVGMAGDWTTATLGYVERVRVSSSDQATINDNGTELHLWQREMFAVKATVEVGFRVRDIAAFRKLTGAVTNLVA